MQADLIELSIDIPPVRGEIAWNSTLGRNLVFAVGQHDYSGNPYEAISRTLGATILGGGPSSRSQIEPEYVPEFGSGVTGFGPPTSPAHGTHIRWDIGTDGANGSVRLLTDFTMAAWVRTPASFTITNLLFDNGMHSAAGTGRFGGMNIGFLVDGSPYAMFGDFAGATTDGYRQRIGDVGLVKANTTHLIAGYYPGTNTFPTLYLDGLERPAKSPGGDVGTGSSLAYGDNALSGVRIGGYELGVLDELYCEGIIGPCFMWRGKLSDYEHQMLYAPQTRWSMFERESESFTAMSAGTPFVLLRDRSGMIGNYA